MIIEVRPCISLSWSLRFLFFLWSIHSDYIPSISKHVSIFTGTDASPRLCVYRYPVSVVYATVDRNDCKLSHITVAASIANTVWFFPALWLQWRLSHFVTFTCNITWGERPRTVRDTTTLRPFTRSSNGFQSLTTIRDLQQRLGIATSESGCVYRYERCNVKTLGTTPWPFTEGNASLGKYTKGKEQDKLPISRFLELRYLLQPFIMFLPYRSNFSIRH